MKDELNPLLDAFGKAMDEFLKINHIQMLIDMPEGTIEPEITDNTRMGSVVQFYILLTSLVPVFREMVRKLGGDFEWQGFIDGCLELVRAEVAEGMESEGGK